MVSIMRIVCLALVTVLSLASATPSDDEVDVVIGRTVLVDKDVRVKQKALLKLFNHILQPTFYTDIENVARDYKLENNLDKYTNSDVVKKFIILWNNGILPRGEIFCTLCEKQMKEGIHVFHVLFHAKDFDTFIRTACWMRQRINEGMFVYALTIAVLHREDCRGIVLPAPYEIYPYFFVNADVIQKAYILKIKRGALDANLLEYYGIRVTGDNIYLIDSMDKDLRMKMHFDDKLNYFTEDIDLNTYYYYFHMEYPLWMSEDVFGINKDRRGELYYFVQQQLLARYNLERLSHGTCDVKMLSWWLPVKKGYWPMLRHHNGVDMPLRQNNLNILNDNNVHLFRLVKDYEDRIREAIIEGYLITNDGTRFDLKKSEDIEYLGRLIHGNLDKDDIIFHRYLELFCKILLGVDTKTVDEYHTTPTVIEQFETALRDPVFWQLQRRIIDNFLAYKKLFLPYTRSELDFPGVKINNIVTNKLITYYDAYDIDITNAVILDTEEIRKQKEDMIFMTRKLRLNHQPFTISIDVISDKAVDCIVRIFLGPKEDCFGNELDLNENRHNFLEIETFLHNLKTGQNIIKRNSIEFNNIIKDREPTRKWWDIKFTETDTYDKLFNVDFWYKSRIGFPQRLILPKGRRGGLEMQLYVVVSPVKTDKTSKDISVDDMIDRKVCRSSVCFDTMPLGFPFDRVIDVTNFNTRNMKFTDVLIFHRKNYNLKKIDYRMSNEIVNIRDNLLM